MKKKFILKIALSLIIVCGAILFVNNEVRAENAQDIYESLLTNNEKEATSSGNIIYAQYVTNLMTKSAYWKSKAQNVNKVLMSLEEIKKLNQDIVDANGTKVFDLETIKKPLRATTVEKFENALQTSKYPDGTERGEKIYYAVVVKRADMKCWPTDEVIGYSKSDPDDETESYALNVNEPVVIRDVCVVDGKTFYFCQAKVCSRMD